MKFENHGGPCVSGCERIACMCAHEKLARVLVVADKVVEAAKGCQGWRYYIGQRQLQDAIAEYDAIRGKT